MLLGLLPRPRFICVLVHLSPILIVLLGVKEHLSLSTPDLRHPQREAELLYAVAELVFGYDSAAWVCGICH